MRLQAPYPYSTSSPIGVAGPNASQDAITPVLQPSTLAQLHPQTAPRSRKSSLGPLFLVIAGVLALLLQRNMLSWQAVLVWLGRWWPVTLLAAGLLLMLEWALDNFGKSLPLARRRLGILGVVGLLCIVMTGLAVTTMSDLSRHLAPHGTNIFIEN